MPACCVERDRLHHRGSLPSGFSGEGGPAASAAYSASASFFYAASSELVYVIDTGNHVVRKIDSFGTISTVAGTGTSAGYAGDNGSPTSTKLSSPSGAYVGVNGVMYISDSRSNRIRKVD